MINPPNILKVAIVFVAIFLTSCFFAPSMNLTGLNTHMTRVTEINNITVIINPIDQYLVESGTIAKNSDYVLGAGDIISLSIWGHPEVSISNMTNSIKANYYDPKSSPTKQVDLTYGLSNPSENKSDSYLIDNSGNAYLPFVGKINLAGKTTSQARDTLTQAYKDFIINPNVNLKITGFRSQKVYVMGEVQQSQILPITDVGMNLTSALELVGGINPVTSNVNQIYVLRKKDPKSVEAYLLDAGSVTAMLYAQKFFLRNEDIVYVSTAGIAQFNRVMTQILPAAETIWYTENSIPNSVIPGITN
ncbi:polysaccharide biosynthesis/export family protein [Aquella oligotrophica]|uniref:Uncharacterized protein n=1 Tax=Aquella oligotrophica TaxID=2067065 RepID=A0A2I7N7S7_9NEIS|nr:polysaccharide biosynthesis/export family protein [Aquella oligotrophica]AUR52519.1 hypothetical protein CUN60_09485 [Aquella oligotrophica]